MADLATTLQQLLAQSTANRTPTQQAPPPPPPNPPISEEEFYKQYSGQAAPEISAPTPAPPQPTVTINRTPLSNDPLADFGPSNPGLIPGGLPPPGNPTAVPGITPAVDPLAAALQAQLQLIGARQAELDATIGTIGPKADSIAASRGVLDAQAQQAKADRAYLAEQTRANEARRAEHEAIIAAQNNAEDLINVGRAQRERDQYAYRYQLAGLPAPIEIKLPPGYDGPLPAGMVTKLETLADILAAESANNEKMRQFELEAARIHSANIGLDVTAAQIRSGRVNLTLDEAFEAARIAGFGITQAQINADRASLPPAPGLVFDPVTGTWVEPAIANFNAGVRADEIERLYGPGTPMDLSSLSVDSLISMATTIQASGLPVITIAEMVETMRVKNVPPAVIQRYAAYAQAILDSRNTSGGETLEELAALLLKYLPPEEVSAALGAP